MPLRVSDALVGVLLLGPRHHGDIYTGFDLRALGSIAPAAALALRNAVSLRDQATRERLAARKLAVIIPRSESLGITSLERRCASACRR
jgi:hypothetical protein